MSGNTLYLHQSGYGTFAYALEYAMMFDNIEKFDFFLQRAGIPKESIKFEKIYICQPTTEEIS